MGRVDGRIDDFEGIVRNSAVVNLEPGTITGAYWKIKPVHDDIAPAVILSAYLVELVAAAQQLRVSVSRFAFIAARPGPVGGIALRVADAPCGPVRHLFLVHTADCFGLVQDRRGVVLFVQLAEAEHLVHRIPIRGWSPWRGRASNDARDSRRVKGSCLGEAAAGHLNP